jgi:integrase
LIARRDYVMGKITYISGVRAAELCGVMIGDLHWESGQWGRFLVNGKGARDSGPRPREAYMFDVVLLDLLVQVEPTAGQGAQGSLGRGHGAAHWTGSQSGPALQQGHGQARHQRLAAAAARSAARAGAEALTGPAPRSAKEAARQRME